MNKRHLTLLAAAVATLFTSVTIANAHDQKAHAGHQTSATSASMNSADMTSAEVRKVDVSAKKITLKHEAIKSLDMPGMTMVFQVADAALLEKLQAGDKVKFKAKQEGNAYVVTEIVADK
jgi:Cu(I)/Ag(I) efflux system periplasmic protein CusF